MYEYTAHYGTKDGTPLPVATHADSFSDAIGKFNAWRIRIAENPTADALVSMEPISVINDTLRMDHPTFIRFDL